MPVSGLYITHCNLPIWIDSYHGCSYACSYCLEGVKGRLGSPRVRHGHGVVSVRHFIKGRRTYRTNWCDWSIPLHWGVTSEGFQFCEIEYRRSYRLLELFAASGYPVVISTKSTLLARGQYYELLSRCNAVVQVSMTSPAYDCLEGGPSFRDRFCMLNRLSAGCRRLLIRVQPFGIEDLDFVLGFLRAYKSSGVYGLMFEGLKCVNTSESYPERDGADYVIPLGVLEPAFLTLRDGCHLEGLHFFSAENRLRHLGDSLNCCGTDGLDGFQSNRANLNYEAALRVYTPSMRDPGTAGVFQTSRLSMDERRSLRVLSFQKAMEDYDARIQASQLG